MLQWDFDAIISLCGRALQARADEADLEQSPLGLDALDELSIQPLLRDAIVGCGYGVLAEQRYPTFRSRHRLSEGDRCDIVLTARPGLVIGDRRTSETLFADLAAAPEDALWLEVKVIHQHHVSDGAGRANPGYSGRFLRDVTADVRRLAGDSAIASAGLILILFTATREIADHDVQAWRERAISRGLPVRAPFQRRFDIADRIGNAVCSMYLFPIGR